MEMRPGRIAGGANRTDNIPCLNHIPFLHIQGIHMIIETLEAKPMVDHDRIPLCRVEEAEPLV